MEKKTERQIRTDRQREIVVIDRKIDRQTRTYLKKECVVLRTERQNDKHR